MFGFVKNKEEPCVYMKVSGSALVILILYVDDILLIGNDIPMLESVKVVGKKFFYEGPRRGSIYLRNKDL